METISTPCTGVCRLDPLRALCEGCGRTAREIAAWSTMSETERRAIMATLADRGQTMPAAQRDDQA
jgi:uncharacterized protein